MVAVILFAGAGVAVAQSESSSELLLAIEPSVAGATSVSGAVGFGALPGQPGHIAPAPPGTLDGGFGDAGVGEIPVPGGSAQLLAMATDATGRTLLVGTSASDQAELARLTSAGVIDTSFGGGAVSLPTGLFPVDLAVTPQGNILVAVVSPSGTFGLVQYTTTGALDTSFGEEGTTGFPSVQSLGGAMSVDSQGRIVLFINYETADAAATTGVSWNLRLLPTGSVDADYPQRVLSSAAFSLAVRDSETQPDDSVAFTGTGTPDVGQSAFVIGRLLGSGQWDPEFGTPNPGYYTDATQPTVNFSGAAITVQADGKYLVVGDLSDSSAMTNSGFISRTNSDGSPDLPFGAPADDPNEGLGAIKVVFGDLTGLQDVAVQANGKILAVGFAQTAELTNALTMRLSATGRYDPTFGDITAQNHLPGEVNGAVFGPIAGRNVAVQVNRDGRFRVGGSSLDDDALWALQYNASGVESVTVDAQLVIPSDPQAQDISSQKSGTTASGREAVSVPAEVGSDGRWLAQLGGPLAPEPVEVTAVTDDGSITSATMTPSPSPSSSPTPTPTPTPTSPSNTPSPSAPTATGFPSMSPTQGRPATSASTEQATPAATGVAVAWLVAAGLGLLFAGTAARTWFTLRNRQGRHQEKR